MRICFQEIKGRSPLEHELDGKFYFESPQLISVFIDQLSRMKLDEFPKEIIFVRDNEVRRHRSDRIHRLQPVCADQITSFHETTQRQIQIEEKGQLRRNEIQLFT